jgi:triosephosphate isomerase
MTIIAANWKMYKTRAEAADTAAALVRLFPSPACEIVLFAPFTALAAAGGALKGSGFKLGAQNVYPADEGAFTGEISPRMLLDAGCAWVLAGHSERRHILGESPDFVGAKTRHALQSGLKVIVCIGETLREREDGLLDSVLTRQTDAALSGLAPEAFSDLAIAYEPVWAIGTGKTATADDILAAHGIVRALVRERCGESGRTMPILYGGSVKPDNASGILGLDNVNGLLVGGSSLHVDSFAEIIRAVPRG